VEFHCPPKINVKEVLEKVRKKFVVDLPELPDTIDASTYMTS